MNFHGFQTEQRKKKQDREYPLNHVKSEIFLVCIGQEVSGSSEQSDLHQYI